MPRGQTHDKIVLGSLIPTFVIGAGVFNDIGLASTLTLATLFGAFLLSPDLDVKSSNYYRWGFLRFIWLPYIRLIRHRSWGSHSFVVGPAIKLIYLFVIIVMMAFLFNLFLVSSSPEFVFNGLKYKITLLLEKYYMYLIVVLLGIYWANAQHLMADYAVSIYKRIFFKNKFSK